MSFILEFLAKTACLSLYIFIYLTTDFTAFYNINLSFLVLNLIKYQLESISKNKINFI